jgi:hypothetical protein
MPYFEKPAHAFEATAEDFGQSFDFDAEDGLRKTVSFVRTGRYLRAEIQYVDGAVTDTAVETFEADGPVRISVMDGGVYLTSYRELLAGRVRLRRTRFF